MASIMGLIYWLIFVYKVESLIAFGAIAFLALPCLVSLLTIPKEIGRLIAIWQSSDPATLDEAIKQVRGRE